MSGRLVVPRPAARPAPRPLPRWADLALLPLLNVALALLAAGALVAGL
jgi:hypothetical protein